MEDEFRGSRGPGIEQVGEDLFLIDVRINGMESTCGVYYVRGERPALVDTGMSSSARRIIRALRSLGDDPREVEYIFLTHLHNDHAGGAPYLLDHMPLARVAVSETALPEIKAFASRMEELDEEEIDYGAFFGKARPLPENRLLPLGDGDRVELGGFTLRARSTPGHAEEHLSFIEGERGMIFVGDALGFFFPRVELLIPSLYAPSFDPAVTQALLKRVEEWGGRTLLFPHFGCSKRAGSLLGGASEFLAYAEEMVASALEEEAELSEVSLELLSETGIRGTVQMVTARMLLESLVIGLAYYMSKKNDR